MVGPPPPRDSGPGTSPLPPSPPPTTPAHPLPPTDTCSHNQQARLKRGKTHGKRSIGFLPIRLPSMPIPKTSSFQNNFSVGSLEAGQFASLTCLPRGQPAFFFSMGKTNPRTVWWGTKINPEGPGFQKCDPGLSGRRLQTGLKPYSSGSGAPCSPVK